jgi:antitoxin (DNA-binding transcriptional repressor) of toxin-antitoxin stability system
MFFSRRTAQLPFLVNVVTRDYIALMRTIGIRALKAELSSAIRDVQRGEIFLVTDRGRVVAELRSPSSDAPQPPGTKRGLQSLATAGALRVAERAPGPYAASPLSSPAGTAQRLIDEDRGE